MMTLTAHSVCSYLCVSVFICFYLCKTSRLVALCPRMIADEPMDGWFVSPMPIHQPSDAG
jgi:hypothetical protein